MYTSKHPGLHDPGVRWQGATSFFWHTSQPQTIVTLSPRVLGEGNRDFSSVPYWGFGRMFKYFRYTETVESYSNNVFKSPTLGWSSPSKTQQTANISSQQFHILAFSKITSARWFFFPPQSPGASKLHSNPNISMKINFCTYLILL